jgi:hypothetical protein
MSGDNESGEQAGVWHYTENERSAGGKWYTVCRVDGAGPVMPAMINAEGAQHWADYLNALEAQAARVTQLEAENTRLQAQAQRSWDERGVYLDHLRNLLARIHRDGGHYVEEHGLDKAVEDAHQVWADLRLQEEALNQNPIARGGRP